LIIDISPSDDELFKFMEKIVNDIPLEDGLKLNASSRKEVVDILRKNTRGELNLRKLVRGLNIMAALGNTGDVERMIKLYA
jgi:PBP1b-binding outer membrane lipoprotein LpoB